MDHVAIMKKSWGLIPKILDGRKKIESRWGKNKSAPFGKINTGDTVYFKNSGDPVTAKAEVSKVLSFENLNHHMVREILEKYGGVGRIAVNNIDETFEWAKEKRYCTLIHLINPQEIKPFNINKKGFGMSSAWMCVGDIGKVMQLEPGF